MDDPAAQRPVELGDARAGARRQFDRAVEPDERDRAAAGLKIVAGGKDRFGRFLDDGGRGVSVSAGLSYVGDRAGSIERDYVVLPAYVKAKAAVEYALSPRLTLRAEARDPDGLARLTAAIATRLARHGVTIPGE